MIPVEVATAPWHYTTFWDWLDHWQTLIAGFLAFVAGVGTVVAAIGAIWVTRSTARKQIDASREDADSMIAAARDQTEVTAKQTETIVRLERRRAAREGYAFHATIWAAMERVLLEASEAKSIFLSANTSERATTSNEAFEARRHFSKGAFSELRAACVRYGGRTTRDLLELERDIDIFASQLQEVSARALGMLELQQGLHAGFLDQLGKIEAKATYLHDKAIAEMERANDVLADTSEQ